MALSLGSYTSSHLNLLFIYLLIYWPIESSILIFTLSVLPASLTSPLWVKQPLTGCMEHSLWVSYLIFPYTSLFLYTTSLFLFLIPIFLFISLLSSISLIASIFAILLYQYYSLFASLSWHIPLLASSLYSSLISIIDPIDPRLYTSIAASLRACITACLF